MAMFGGKFLAMTALAGLAMSGVAQASLIAYDNASGVGTLQNWTGSLGLDFTVNQPISVTSLGAFDNGVIANLIGSDGSSGVTVGIFNLATDTLVGTEVTFTPTNAGTQINGDAFLSVTPFLLSTGNYTVVSFNDTNYNSQGGANGTSTTDTGYGGISFTGWVYGYGTSFPTIAGNNPVNRFDAGTFEFLPVPEPASFAILGAGLAGLFGFGMRRRRS